MSVIIWWLIFKDDLDKKYHTQPEPFQFLWNLASHSIFMAKETSLCNYTSVIPSDLIPDIIGTNKLDSLKLCMNSMSFITNMKQCVILEGQLKIMQPSTLFWYLMNWLNLWDVQIYLQILNGSSTHKCLQSLAFYLHQSKMPEKQVFPRPKCPW